MVREKYYSQSKIKTWRRCHKAYDYRYGQGLVRRTAPVALLRGTTLHAMLEANIKGEDWTIPLGVYAEQYGKLWAEEAEQYPHPDELKGIYERYQRHWANDGLTYDGRAEVELIVEHRGIIFKGIIDAFPKDKQDRIWLSDHKTHKILPDEHTRFSDIQTVLYYWMAKQEKLQVDGILWDYLRTKPPAIPEVLKSGGLSKRSNIDTDRATYEAEIKKHRLNPADYQDILAKVDRNVFFQRIYLPNPAADLIHNVVTEAFDTAIEIENSTSTCRNMTRDCKSCTFYPICSAEVRGIDSSFIRKQLFTLREEKE
jgi:hypothetical protein